MMFRDFDSIGGNWPYGPRRIETLPSVDARLIWALRRLALMQPVGAARCHAVHIALQQDFGDCGLGIEHLLRCLLVGLSRRADRQLVFGEPACPLLLPDEAALLGVISAPGVRRALADWAGQETAVLAPLVRSLQTMTKNIS